MRKSITGFKFFVEENRYGFHLFSFLYFRLSSLKLGGGIMSERRLKINVSACISGATEREDFLRWLEEDDLAQGLDTG